MEHSPLYEMVNRLLSVSDDTWGMYAFSREILRDKIPEAEKHGMIAASISCGNICAEQFHKEYHSFSDDQDVYYPGFLSENSIEEHLVSLSGSIVQRFGLLVEFGEQSDASDRVLFALFTPPKQITIMRDPYHRVFSVLKELKGEGLTEINPDQLMDILIGHELFHYVELMNQKVIYTRTRKIKLWSLPFYTHYSTVQTLSEIAGMNFTKRLNHLTFSPYLLDVLLIYEFYPMKAEKMYQDILALEPTVTESFRARSCPPK